MHHDPHRAHRPALRAAWYPPSRAVVWGLAYYGAARLGLLTAVHHLPLVLVAPSAGVGVVWFGTATRRTLLWDLAALVAATVPVAWALGLPLWLVLFAPLPAAAQVGVFCLLMRRWSGGLIPFGGHRAAWRLRDLAVFLAASVLAAAASAALTTVTQGLAGLATGDDVTFLIRWGREVSTMVALGSVGLMAVAAVWARRASDARTSRVRVSPGRQVEAVGLVLVSAVIFWLCVDVYQPYPVTFMFFIVTVWAGTRFSPLTASVHAFALGTATVVLTLTGHGRFAQISDVSARAITAQLFVLVLSGTALTLAVSRSELARAERLADERAELLDSVLYDVDDGVLVLDENGLRVFANPASLRLLGIDESSDRFMIGRGYDLFDLDGEPIPLEATPYVRALHGEVVTGEYHELRWKDGSPSRILRVGARLMAPVGSQDGSRVLASIHDVTADREREEALALFAGHVAHDLKNPLSVVHAWTETLHDVLEDDGSISAAAGLPMTTKIASASTRMSDFIQELLDYTLARDRALRPQPVDLAAVATDVAQMRTLAASGPAPTITVTGTATALADPVLVRIVVDNLVANAIKYVAPGVDPLVHIAISTADSDRVQVSVTDNGIGIAPEEQQRIFESFVRVGAGSYEGIGLGLGICHQIVQRHGGTIEVVARPQGSCLRFTLPAEVRAATPITRELISE